jgi:hypothetical protein
MTYAKQQRDKLSMLGLLRSLLGASKPPPKQSKVPQPGARPKKKADAGSLFRSNSGFGQRGRRASYR